MGGWGKASVFHLLSGPHQDEISINGHKVPSLRCCWGEERTIPPEDQGAWGDSSRGSAFAPSATGSCSQFILGSDPQPQNSLAVQPQVGHFPSLSHGFFMSKTERIIILILCRSGENSVKSCKM